ncbi:MAG: hypothetical protein R6W90_00770 [Ignavibacteriaceae bacterium]
MKQILLFFSFLLYTSFCFPQESFSFDIFSARLDNSTLLVSDAGGNVFYRHTFNNPSAIEYDLDDDGIGELLLLDSSGVNGKNLYKVFIYNTVDSFYLVDSIISGSYEPYETVSQEIGSTIIITGNAECEIYNGNSEFVFLPLNCWKYEAGEVYLINDEIYELFITENEAITDFIDEYFSSNINNCNTTERLKPAIMSAYINYINAGEKSIASQFIKKYYLCGDIEKFTLELNNLAQTENN